MKAHLFLFALVTSVLSFSSISYARLPCRAISAGETADSYRVIFICNTDEALAAFDALYAGCVELGTRETDTGVSTILSCDFVDADEYADLKAGTQEALEQKVSRPTQSEAIPSDKDPTFVQAKPTKDKTHGESQTRPDNIKYQVLDQKQQTRQDTRQTRVD